MLNRTTTSGTFMPKVLTPHRLPPAQTPQDSPPTHAPTSLIQAFVPPAFERGQLSSQRLLDLKAYTSLRFLPVLVLLLHVFVGNRVTGITTA